MCLTLNVKFISKDHLFQQTMKLPPPCCPRHVTSMGMVSWVLADRSVMILLKHTCWTRRRHIGTRRCLCFRLRPPARRRWTVRSRHPAWPGSPWSWPGAAAPSAWLSSQLAAALGSSPGDGHRRTPWSGNPTGRSGEGKAERRCSDRRTDSDRTWAATWRTGPSRGGPRSC